ncbi:MAG TPA: tetratricopeptide repeat protein [Rhodanobacteraceae bacterium]|nr:tetratricopeptide repeat protein [Rhodanobacteraceae bacterium]
MPVVSDSWLLRIDAALRLAQGGALQEAIAALANLGDERPRESLPHVLLAALHLQSGDLTRALSAVEHAIRIAPGDASALELRAHLLLVSGRPAEAESAARVALQRNPGSLRARCDLAGALEAQRRWQEAINVASEVLAQDPGAAAMRALRARCTVGLGDTNGALALALDPVLLAAPGLARGVAAVFGAAGADQERLALLRELGNLHPGDYACVMSLAGALYAADRAAEALAWADRAHDLRPEAATPLQMRAISLIDRGDVEEGLAIYRELVERGSLNAMDEQRFLVVEHYHPSLNAEIIHADHAAWARRHASPFGTPFIYAPSDTARTRLGWMSPRFDEGPVARFFTGLLRAFDRASHHHTVINLDGPGDACTAEIESLADEVIELAGVEDETLLERLRELRLDVLIDLAGHAPFGRPRVLAQRVAPIQLCWLDYFDSTALPNMDGWISDRWLSPEDSPQIFSERLLRLPSGRFCYTPPGTLSTGHEGDGAPTFVSFNRIAKLNAAVVDAWCRILGQVPDARLMVGARALEDDLAANYLRRRFEQRGIDPDRLLLHGHQPYSSLLQAYRRADIALDPFPFSGCTTSCDALWMGVPVITLPGWSVVSRQTASLLWRLERPQWVASNTDDYVERAVSLAGDVEALRRSRAALRESVELKLCDARLQATEFATLLHELRRARDA